MNDDDFRGWDDLEDELVLPRRETLEAWVVPEPAHDLPDRVLARLKAAPVQMPRAARRGAAPWLWGAIAGGIAAALVLLLAWPVDDASNRRSRSVAVAEEGEEITVAHLEESRYFRPTVSAETGTSLLEEASTTSDDADVVLEKDTRRQRRVEPSEPRRRPEPEEAAKTARFRIGTSFGVPPAKVWVDGEYVGKTPLLSVPVTAGTHEVLFRFHDREDITLHATIEDGEVKTLKAG